MGLVRARKSVHGEAAIVEARAGVVRPINEEMRSNRLNGLEAGPVGG